MKPKWFFYLAGGLIALSAALFLAAYFTLSAAIHWPQSLRMPAAEVFPMLLAREADVFRGYYFYLLSSLLWIPMFVSVRSALCETDGAANPGQNLFLDLTVSLAALAATFKALGIVRWLFAMPLLARIHEAPGADAAGRANASMLYDVLNLYAGKVGEHLGVGVATFAMLASLGVALLYAPRARWLAFSAWIVAVLNLPWRDFFPATPGWFASISVSALLFWMLLFASSLILRARNTE